MRWLGRVSRRMATSRARRTRRIDLAVRRPARRCERAARQRTGPGAPSLGNGAAPAGPRPRSPPRAPTPPPCCVWCAPSPEPGPGRTRPGALSAPHPPPGTPWRPAAPPAPLARTPANRSRSRTPSGVTIAMGTVAAAAASSRSAVNWPWIASTTIWTAPVTPKMKVTVCTNTRGGDGTRAPRSLTTGPDTPMDPCSRPTTVPTTGDHRVAVRGSIARSGRRRKLNTNTPMVIASAISSGSSGRCTSARVPMTAPTTPNPTRRATDPGSGRGPHGSPSTGTGWRPGSAARTDTTASSTPSTSAMTGTASTGYPRPVTLLTVAPASDASTTTSSWVVVNGVDLRVAPSWSAHCAPASAGWRSPTMRVPGRCSGGQSNSIVMAPAMARARSRACSTSSPAAMHTARRRCPSQTGLPNNRTWDSGWASASPSPSNRGHPRPVAEQRDRHRGPAQLDRRHGQAQDRPGVQGELTHVLAAEGHQPGVVGTGADLGEDDLVARENSSTPKIPCPPSPSTTAVATSTARSSSGAAIGAGC